MAKITDKLRELISESGLTQMQIMDLSGVSQHTISRLVCGKSINTDSADKLNAALNEYIAKKVKRLTRVARGQRADGDIKEQAGPEA